MPENKVIDVDQNSKVAAQQVKSASLKSEVDSSLSEKETAANLKVVEQQKKNETSILDKLLGPIQSWYNKRSESKEEKQFTNTKEGDKITNFNSKESSQPIESDLCVYPPKINDSERKEILSAEKVYNEGVMKLQDLIAPSAMKVMYKGLQVSGLFTRSFFVYSYPRFINTNWLSPVINFDVTMDMSQFIYPIDSSSIMKVLKTKVAQMQSTMRINAEKGLVRDPALETALQDAESLRTAIQRGQEKFFQYGLYFTIYSDDEDKLEKISKQLESILGGRLVLTKKADLRAEQAFNSTLPLGLDEIEVHRNMNTSPLSSTFPFTSSELTSNEGILYGLNRHNDSLIIFDRFSLENANSVVFAKSGAGKSYTIKLEILRYLMLGTDVIVIDPENEYEALCQTVGGSYMKVSLNSDRRINPFDLPTPLKGETLKPGDLLRSAIINLHGLLKLMLGGISPSEEGILDKALNDVYSLKGITMDLVDPSEKEPPTMEDLQNVLSGMQGAESLVQRLQKFTTGTYSGVFNKPTNIDLATGLVVFSIRDLEDALRPIAIYIILNYIWNKVRSNLKQRLLVIDEAWSLMQHEDSARFLYGLVKRARKYYLGVTTITQDVEDFLRSDLGKPVITNSSMQVLLKQSPTAAEKLQEIFNLTEGEKYLLLNSGVGQGLFFAGNKHVAIQVIASYTEDKIVTTNPKQLMEQADNLAAKAESNPKTIQEPTQQTVDPSKQNPQ
jgi:type IV secretory pathway VirB4 component